MAPSFDLTDAPWIPCTDAAGRAVELSLCETLTRAPELRELGGDSPLATAALYRLLLAVTHRVTNGPEGYDAWAALWKAGRFDTTQIEAYLAQWRERFDLFHPERPFYQRADDRLRPKSLTSLVHDAASGNNATLFDHHTDAEGLTFTPAQAARALLAAQAFGLAGLCLPGHPFTDAPCARGIIFLAQGDTVFETLLLNLLRYDDERPLPGGPQDCPAWEMDDPFTPGRQIPYGYLDYLTWQNRRVLYLPEESPSGPVVREMTLGPGLRLDATVADPMKHYRKDKVRGLLVLRFNEDRALWRDSAALFSLTRPDYRPPLIFNWLAELVGEGIIKKEQARRMLALGMANNQAKVEFFRAERWPLPLAYLRKEQLVEALQTALNMAEAVSNQLWGAARTLATLFVCPEADQEGAHQPDRGDLDKVMGQWDVKRRYWAQLEPPFRLTLEALPADRDGTLADWRETLRRAAWRAFDGAAENLADNPRTLKAAVRAREQLATGLGKALPEPKTSEVLKTSEV
jgi:CRISPR system Cascade subunit CasA